MSIATSIASLQEAQTNIQNALIEKGVAAQGHGFSSFSTDIGNIQTGGGTDGRVAQIIHAGGEIDLSDCTGMTTVRQYLFISMPALTKLTLPNSCKTIGWAGCSTTGLKEIIFGTNFVEVGTQGLANSTKMERIDFRKVQQVVKINANSITNIPSTCKIIVPDDLYESWLTSYTWSTFESQIIKASEE